MLAAERAPWQNARILGTLILVFIAGAATGALSMRLGLHERLHRSAPSWREGNKEIFLQKFKNDLDLTSQQTEQVAAILEDYTQYYQSLEDQLDEVRATGKNRIMQVLNERQRQKFEKMLADLQSSR